MKYQHIQSYTCKFLEHILSLVQLNWVWEKAGVSRDGLESGKKKSYQINKFVSSTISVQTNHYITISVHFADDDFIRTSYSVLHWLCSLKSLIILFVRCQKQDHGSQQENNGGFCRGEGKQRPT